TRESGAGLDAGLLQGKMNVTIDYFDKRTTGILLAVPVGAPYGLKSPVQNAATMSNKGWEFSVGYNDKKGDFTYYGSLNATFINNKITDLHGTGPNISGYTVQQVGSPYGALYGYVAQGLFQSADQVKNHAYQSVKTGPGDIIYKDLDGNDTINSADRQYLGNSYPKITFGMNLGASWRNFDLSVLLQGAAGVKAYMDLGKLGGVSPDANKPTSALLDNWTVDNPNASFPRLWYANHQNDPSNTPSSFWVKNGAYLRVKNLQIGYTLPESLTKRMGITRLRIYYSGQNILTFDSLYKWVDPEEATTSSIYYYPQVKVNTIGLNVTF
ncbi:MAG TPA: hypothetical protein VL053_20340, partial [Arachidicoccus sp.]|nr:hypothetical protein [Arachidicoccus sp.]